MLKSRTIKMTIFIAFIRYLFFYPLPSQNFPPLSLYL